MPRLMPFAKTIDQVRSKQKTVTRREGWEWLEKGALLKPVDKVMGFKKGESPTPIFGDGTLIRVVDVRREPLGALDPVYQCHEIGHDPEADHPYYSDLESNNEATREGFPGMDGPEFVEFFCEEMGVDPRDKVTRIQFEYVGPEEA